jgi:deoxycytidylate deaminase
MDSLQMCIQTLDTSSNTLIANVANQHFLQELVLYQKQFTCYTCSMTAKIVARGPVFGTTSRSDVFVRHKKASQDISCSAKDIVKMHSLFIPK